jgi:hypothetical protein
VVQAVADTKNISFPSFILFFISFSSIEISISQLFKTGILIKLSVQIHIILDALSIE